MTEYDLNTFMLSNLHFSLILAFKRSLVSTTVTLAPFSTNSKAVK